MLLLQIPPPPAGSIDPFIGWLLTLVLSMLTATIGKLYWDSRQESKRKDALIDRLLEAELANAKANEESVSLLKQERGRPR